MIDLARAITRTASIHEASWSDVDKHYMLPIDEAAGIVTQDKKMANLIDIILTAAWNDVLMWAMAYEETYKPPPKKRRRRRYYPADDYPL